MRHLFLGLSLSLFSPLAFSQGDVDNRDEIALAAHDLSDAAEHFHEVIHDIAGYSHLSADVHRFAQMSEHFHESVEGGAPTQHIRRDYQKLRMSFHHVQTALSDAHQIHHNQHVWNDWRNVEYANQELRMEMQRLHNPHGHEDWPEQH